MGNSGRLCQNCRKQKSLKWDPEGKQCYDCKYPDAIDAESFK